MTDLVKGVFGGGWSLVVGWILPAFLSLQLITGVVLPAAPNRFTAIHTFLAEPAATRQLTLLAIAAVAGLVLAAMRTTLYRILEGYVLWPPPLAEYRIRKHRKRRAKLVAKQEKVATDKAVRRGLLYERAARYPVADIQIAPTMLGNAIRRFETYAGDRYKLDAQLLWGDLTAAAPAPAVAAVDNARTNVDFFVCLLYGGVSTLLLAGVTAGTAGQMTVRLWLAAGIGMLLAVACYWLAVRTTDDWDAAFRAVVDHGRAGVAAAFGLKVPASFDDERHMWQVVNTLVRRPFSYSESKDVPSLIERFRSEMAQDTPSELLPTVVCEQQADGQPARPQQVNEWEEQPQQIDARPAAAPVHSPQNKP